MNLYLEYWKRSVNLNIIESPRNLKYILKTREDFKDYEFNTLLLDEEKYQFWKNNVEYNNSKISLNNSIQLDRYF